MHQYMISYFGGDYPESQQQQEKYKIAFATWIESMGHAVITPIVNLNHTHTLHKENNITAGSDVAMSAYSIIRAVDIEQAVDYTQSCPFLALNGWIEVAEMVEPH